MGKVEESSRRLKSVAQEEDSEHENETRTYPIAVGFGMHLQMKGLGKYAFQSQKALGKVSLYLEYSHVGMILIVGKVRAKTCIYLQRASCSARHISVRVAGSRPSNFHHVDTGT